MVEKAGELSFFKYRIGANESSGKIRLLNSSNEVQPQLSVMVQGSEEWKKKQRCYLNARNVCIS